MNNGNEEPYRGFGHIAVMTKDVYAASAELEAAGVAFRKRPDEGRMKGLAFALDPDGYWIEIIKRAEDSVISNKYTLAQTMMRVKDPEKSLKFYKDLLGMTLLRSSDLGDFSLYFLASGQVPEGSQMNQVSLSQFDLLRTLHLIFPYISSMMLRVFLCTLLFIFQQGYISNTICSHIISYCIDV